MSSKFQLSVIYVFKPFSKFMILFARLRKYRVYEEKFNLIDSDQVTTGYTEFTSANY